ncbi:MAG TPA: hypothetical protein VFA43_21025 [Gemmatimonadaceae bacterium]|nr:hypothetical protein [Gemmatimonadaceae bacterium]
MNHDEHPDSILIKELRDAVHDLTVSERPSLAAIVDRGRANRRKRRGRVASAGVATIIAGGALALGLTSVHDTPPGTTSSTHSADGGPATIRTDSFTLVSYANGKAKLTLTNSQVFDPSVLRRALGQDGIPALVKRNVYCFSDPAPPDPNSIGVLSIRPRLMAPTGFAPAKALLKLYRRQSPTPDLKALINHTVTVINPAKMPAGTELAFDYAPGRHLIAVDLVYTKTHTCKSGPAAG